MSELRNEFSWSKSRDEVFQACPKANSLTLKKFEKTWGNGIGDLFGGEED